MNVRRVLPLGILAMLCACGPPASDAGLTAGKAKAGDSAPAPKTAAPPPAPTVRVSIHRGLYRRLGKDSHFRPCGAPTPLVVIGTGPGLAQLAEQFRWNSVWAGQNLFGVFEGLIRTDTQFMKNARTD